LYPKITTSISGELFAELHLSFISDRNCQNRNTNNSYTLAIFTIYSDKYEW